MPVGRDAVHNETLPNQEWCPARRVPPMASSVADGGGYSRVLGRREKKRKRRYRRG